jgi:uncharacterized protein YndB with AHSA1/START domain
MSHQLPAITVQTTVNTTIDNTWQAWTTPADISQWNNMSDDWHTPLVEVDLKNGGTFLFRMETKDGSAGFDHSGRYDRVVVNEVIEYTVFDGRKSVITFESKGDHTLVTETFEPEKETPIDLQKNFCQSILNTFKKYTEEKFDRNT